MNCTLKVENPGTIKYTLTITMQADDWDRLRDQLAKSELSTSYPASRLRDEIYDLLKQARRVYFPRTDSGITDAALMDAALGRKP